MHLYIYIFVYVYMYIHTCIHIYIYIEREMCAYVYLHMYTYTQIENRLFTKWNQIVRRSAPMGVSTYLDYPMPTLALPIKITTFLLSYCLYSIQPALVHTSSQSGRLKDEVHRHHGLEFAISRACSSILSSIT